MKKLLLSIFIVVLFITPVFSEDLVKDSAEGIGYTKQEAMINAQTILLGKVCGTLIRAEDLIQNHVLIKSRIVSTVDGYLASGKILKAWEKDDIWHVLYEGLVRRGIVNRAYAGRNPGKPAILVLGLERLLDRGQSSDQYDIARDAVRKELIEKFKIFAQSFTAEDIRILKNGAHVWEKRMIEIAKEKKVDLVCSPIVEIRKIANLGSGQKKYQVSVKAGKIFNVYSGEMLYTTKLKEKVFTTSLVQQKVYKLLRDYGEDYGSRLMFEIERLKNEQCFTIFSLNGKEGAGDWFLDAFEDGMGEAVQFDIAYENTKHGYLVIHTNIKKSNKKLYKKFRKLLRKKRKFFNRKQRGRMVELMFKKKVNFD